MSASTSGQPETSESPASGSVETWANRAFAVSALIAAGMRCWHAKPDEFWLPATIGVAAINLAVAMLFLLRGPVVSLGSPWQLASCLPTMLASGLALRFAPPPPSWPWWTNALFTAGAAMTIGALAWLGRSFGVMPARRQTVVGGPYRLVRHPAYAGEMLVMLACFLAGPSPAAASVWLLLIPGIVWRILAEEAVLSADSNYQAYRRQVRWRLIPGIW